MARRLAFSLLLWAALAACSDAGTEPGPGGVSKDDAEALDEAAAKLDAEMTEPPQ